MTITKEIHVHAGHVVSSQVNDRGEPGKCARMAHGHSYRIIATANGKVLQDNVPNGGMVLDFSILKTCMMKTIYEEADHAFYIWEKDSALQAMKAFAASKDKDLSKLHILPCIPTAENLAKYWFNLLQKELEKYSVSLEKIEVFETPTSSAIYERLRQHDCFLVNNKPFDSEKIEVFKN